MLDSIEGISNLHYIYSFLNNEVINQSLDLKKKVEYELANSKSLVVCEGKADEVFRGIISLFNKTGGSPTVAVVEKVPPKVVPTVVPDLNAPKSLQDTFTFNPKPKTNVVEPTLFETNSYNKILYGNGSYSEEMEQERDTMLENIEDLRFELSSMDGINIKNIPIVDKFSNINDVRSVYKLLLHKKNMGMYFETAKDVVMIGINKLVGFCDGSPGRPNLTGWDKTANFKLNSLKTEMANMVSGFFKDYSIPPIMQILFSLVPSAFLHASLRSRQSGLQATNDSALSDLRSLM